MALRSERSGGVEDGGDSRWLRGLDDKKRGSFPEGAGGAKREFRKAAQAGAGFNLRACVTRLCWALTGAH